MIIAFMLAAATTLAAPLPPLPPCRPYVAGAPLAEGGETGMALAAAWPAAWRSRGTIADNAVPAADMRRAVGVLACTATWPGEEERAIALALPLFGSKRHSSAAFMALDGMARSSALPGPVRAAAHGFRARMRHAIAQRYDKV